MSLNGLWNWLDPESLLGNPMQLSLWALGIFVVYEAFATFRTWYRLRDFSGPFLASVSHLWLVRTVLSGRAWRIHLDLRYRYGPLIRIGPNMLINDDPDVLRHINSARSRYMKSEWYSPMRFDPYVHTAFSSRDVVYHDDVKARILPGYSGKEVPTLESDIDEQVEGVKRLIRRKYLSTADETRPVDFSLVANYFTLDSLTRIAYGKEFGYLETDSDFNGYIKMVETTNSFFALCADVPWIGNFFFSSWVLKLIGPKTSDKSGVGMMMGVAQKVVSDRFGPDAVDRKDMLGSFVRHGLSKSQCEAEVLMQIVAGSDTTAGVVRAALLFIATTPRVYYRLQKEIDEGVANGKISTPVTYGESKNLSYLTATIYESMRYHPPVFTLLPKIVPPEGDTLLGRFVPGGTRIAVNAWGMMRQRRIFGDDVDVFRPERWTDASGEKRIEMERTCELIFGIGRYMCAGKTVAFMELNKIFVELFREFDFQIINPKVPWVEAQYSIFLINDMWMRVTSRVK